MGKDTKTTKESLTAALWTSLMNKFGGIQSAKLYFEKSRQGELYRFRMGREMYSILAEKITPTVLAAIFEGDGGPASLLIICEALTDFNYHEERKKK